MRFRWVTTVLGGGIVLLGFVQEFYVYHGFSNGYTAPRGIPIDSIPYFMATLVNGIELFSP